MEDLDPRLLLALIVTTGLALSALVLWAMDRYLFARAAR